MSIEGKHNYVLTNCLYENEGDRKLYNQVKALAEKRGSVFAPVKLIISEGEHLKRITHPERHARQKTVDPKYVHDEITLLNIEHSNLLELHVSELSAEQVANKILEHTQKLTKADGI